MTNREDKIERYAPHKGTCRVSGVSKPASTAQYAYGLYMSNIWPIDFLVVGGNANQQAMKAMGILRNRLIRVSQGRVSVAYQPLRFLISIKGEVREATAWRTLLIPNESNLLEIPKDNLITGNNRDSNEVK